MKSKLAAFLTIGSLTLASQSVADDAYFADFPLDHDWSNPSQNFFEVTDAYNLGTGSYYEYWDEKKSSNSVSDFCESLTSESCTEKVAENRAWESDQYILAYPVMGVCDTPADNFCIEAVRLYKAGATESHPAVYQRYVKSLFTQGSKKLNIPDGKAASLWEASPESGLGDLKVSAFVSMRMVNYPLSGSNAKKFRIDEFDVFLTPYREIAGPNFIGAGLQPISDRLRPGPNQTNTKFLQVSPRNQCAWSEDQVCGRIQNWPEGVKAGITLRIDREVATFFSGRLKDPQIDIQPISAGVRRLTLDAEPVRVAKFFAAVPINSEENKKLKLSGYHSTKAWFPNALSAMETLKNVMQDANSGEVSEWRISARQATGIPSCYAKAGDFAGIVTTNAIAYEDSPPRYTKGFLDYKVGGMHYESDKTTEFIGTYDFLLKSEVARCIYSFSKAPVSATVTVVGGADKTIATTLVSEKNGWLKIAAYGFTFSQKTIKVKLSQKKSTITCVSLKNEKLVRKVTNFSSSCPSGYRKK